MKTVQETPLDQYQATQLPSGYSGVIDTAQRYSCSADIGSVDWPISPLVAGGMTQAEAQRHAHDLNNKAATTV